MTDPSQLPTPTLNPKTLLSNFFTPGPAPNVTARGYSGFALAVTGAVLWALGAYVYHGSVPTAVVAIIDIEVPAAVGYIAAHITRVTTQPQQPQILPAAPQTQAPISSAGAKDAET